MQVTPYIETNLTARYRGTNGISFMGSGQAKEQKTELAGTPSRDEILHAKTKKAVSECACITLGVIILYFATKRSFKYNEIDKEKRRLASLARLEVPKSLKELEAKH